MLVAADSGGSGAVGPDSGPTAHLENWAERRFGVRVGDASTVPLTCGGPQDWIDPWTVLLFH